MNEATIPDDYEDLHNVTQEPNGTHAGPHAGAYNGSSGANRLQRWLDPLASLWSPTSQSEPPAFTQKDILIAVMGMTGAGKTTFISDVAGVNMEIGHGLDSCTKEVQIATARINGHTVHFIDTPGFDDTDLTDSDILLRIANYLRGTGSKPIRLTGILYLHRITDIRLGGTALKNLSMFRKLVGEKNMGNVILLTTMWSKVSPEEGRMRLQELVGKGKFWGPLVTAGATYDRYGDTRKDGRRIVVSMMKNSPIVTQLQTELESGMKLSDTKAGRDVENRLEKLQAQHEQEMRELREEMQEASRVRNMELHDELQAHYEKLIQELRDASDQREKMHKTDLEAMQQRVTELEARPSCIVM